MHQRTRKRLFTPMIGRVAMLNEYVLRKRGKAKKVIQYNYVDDMLKQCFLLFKYAMRQLSGKDYVKRSIELCEEIQCSAYLIARLGGYTARMLVSYQEFEGCFVQVWEEEHPEDEGEIKEE